MQYFGEPLDIKVWVRHTCPMVQGCLGIQVISQSQAPTTAVYVYPPHCVFGRDLGTTLIRFHIPELRANVGLFSLRIYLTETPRGKVYELIDGVCGFEVVRHDFFPGGTRKLVLTTSIFPSRSPNETDPCIRVTRFGGRKVSQRVDLP